VVNRQRIKVIVVLTAVFLLGAVAGGALVRALAERSVAHRPEAFWLRPSAMRVQALARELDLSDSQRRDVARILDEERVRRQELMRQTMDQCGAPVLAHKQELDAKIRAVLTPEQRTRFDDIAERQGDFFFAPPGPGYGRGGGRHRPRGGRQP
jgi:Spy/CpxP family protein refolding chaperone